MSDTTFWAGIIRKAHVSSGTAEDLSISAAGVPATYLDCQVTPKSDSALLPNGQRGVRHFLRITIPRLNGATEPPDRSTLTWNSKTWTTGPAAAQVGYWSVEATGG